MAKGMPDEEYDLWLDSLEQEREYPCEDPLAEALAEEMIHDWEEDIRAGILAGNRYDY